MVYSFYSAVLSVYFISVNCGCLLFWNYGILIWCPLGFFLVFFTLCVSHFVLSRAKNDLSLFDKMKQQGLCTTTCCWCRLTPQPHMLWPWRLHSNQTKRHYVWWSLKAVPDLPSYQSKPKAKTFVYDLRICNVFFMRNWLPHPSTSPRQSPSCTYLPPLHHPPTSPPNNSQFHSHLHISVQGELLLLVLFCRQGLTDWSLL